MARSRWVKLLVVIVAAGLCVAAPQAFGAITGTSLFAGPSDQSLTLAPNGRVQVSCPSGSHLAAHQPSAQAISLACFLSQEATSTTTTSPAARAPTDGRGSTTPSAPAPTRSVTPGARPDPFVASWDQPLGATTAVPDSATLISDFVTGYRSAYGTVGVNGGLLGIPIVSIPADQPDVPISVSAGCNDFTSGGPGATGTGAPIPPGAVVSTTSDAPLIVYQPSTDTVWEFWRIYAVGSGYSACWGGVITGVSTSNGLFPAPYGLAASGVSYLGTAITEADVESGTIDHTVAIDVVDCNGSVSPANRTDCLSDPGYVGEGAWLRLPPGTPEPPDLTPLGQMVFRALVSYGAVVTDHAGAYAFVAQYSATTDDAIQRAYGGQPEWAALAGIPWSALEVINPPS